MRAVKTTTISIFTIGLLAGSAVGVAAQEEESAPVAGPAALVTGGVVSEDRAASREFEESVDAEGLRRERGELTIGRLEMSDERLSGDLTWTREADRFGTSIEIDTESGAFADVTWGTVSIVNDGGTWEGRQVGTSDVSKGGASITYIELVGTEGYEGLSAILFEEEDFASNPWSGVIFPGDLPPDR